MPLAPKLCFVRGGCGGAGRSADGTAKQSFADQGVTKLELGQEGYNGRTQAVRGLTEFGKERAQGRRRYAEGENRLQGNRSGGHGQAKRPPYNFSRHWATANFRLLSVR